MVVQNAILGHLIQMTEEKHGDNTIRKTGYFCESGT